MPACRRLRPAIGQAKNNVPDIIPGAPKVTVEHIKVHGASLEGNLEGDGADRDVLVFLPPSYGKEASRRYPVVYALHGYSIGAEQWSQEIHVPQTIEGAFAKGARDMIVVLPDSKTVHNGSMYSSSVTTGDFENFIAHDLVAYIDAHYRTIAARESRGLVGHSMGGYGATRIGMKHADVFGSLYIMSPCCLSARAHGPLKPEDEAALAGGEDAGGFRQTAVRPARAACHRRGLVAQSRRSRRSISTCRWATSSNRCWPNGRPMRRWPSSTSISAVCGDITRSRWMWAIRTVCAPTPPSCTRCWTVMASPTASRSIPAPMSAMWRSAFRIS